MARPKKTLTPEQIKEVETLAAVLNQEQIADYFGIDAETFVAIRKRDPEVFRSYKRGKAKAIGSIGGNLIKQAKGGNVSAAIFYLKTQAGWSEAKAENDAEAPPLNITFKVNDAVKDIKVTNA
jgi:hypothetical protein|tara:strand:- start:28 stop:396 length:369 start_codon:yes stop_codon:yes gene_type:complete